MGGRLRKPNPLIAVSCRVAVYFGVVAICAAGALQVPAQALAPPECGSGDGSGTTSWGGDVGAGSVGAGGERKCPPDAPTGNVGGGSTDVVVVTYSDCGLDPAVSPSLDCRNYGVPCVPVDGQPVHSFLSHTVGADRRSTIGVWCPSGEVPLSAVAIREAAVKLLPVPVVSSNPPAAGYPLVNMDIVFWLDTPVTQQALGSASLLGHTVEFRAQVATVDWVFGDGKSATSSGPEPNLRIVMQGPAMAEGGITTFTRDPSGR